MGLIIPGNRTARFQTNWSGQPSDTMGTLLTASATPHSLGSITEVIASTNFTTAWVEIAFHNTGVSAAVTLALANIYTGGAGSEQLLIPNLSAGFSSFTSNSGLGHKVFRFPLRIPAGTRISAALRSADVSKTGYIIINLFERGPYDLSWCGTAVESLGADTATSTGVTVTPGLGSDGSLTSIGTTINRWRFVVPMLDANADDTSANAYVSADIGNASAVFSGLEQFLFAQMANETISQVMSAGRFYDLPASTAVYLRARRSGAVTDNVSFCIYGVY